MVSIIIPQGVYTMAAKMSIVSENAPKYRRSRKKMKSQLLDELSSILHYNRKYLSFLLRNAGREVFTLEGIHFFADPKASLLSRRGRKKIYTSEILPYLVLIWELAGCISSVHLAAFIKFNQDIIFTHPKLKHIPPQMKQKLLTISHATIDRLLKPVREKRKLNGRYKPNPHSSSIKKSIPIQPHYQKPKDAFGYLEFDLVHHCGESSGGEFAYTLTATEITTGWTELRTIKNKAQVWTVAALEDIVSFVPFKVTAFHSDNGSEFINAHLAKFARKLGVPFTRSRTYHKNDAPYAESKNWTMVRAYTGYRRYDTEEETLILQETTKLISLKHNLYIPTMKIVSKRWFKESCGRGRKAHKSYTTETPYYRLMTSDRLTEEEKQRLTELRNSTDFFKLSQHIEKLQTNLDRAYHKKYHLREGVYR